MDLFSLKWFVLGILISVPLHWFYISIKPHVTKMPFEDRLATNTITQILSLVIVVGGFALSIYGNYLTATAGGGKVTPDQFNILASQFGYWFEMYVYLIWALIGIAAGTGFMFMIRSIWRYFNHKQTNVGNNQDAEKNVKDSPTITDQIGTNKPSVNINMNISITDKTKAEQFMSLKEIIDKLQSNSKGKDKDE